MTSGSTSTTPAAAEAAASPCPGPVLARAGAVPADGPDTGVACHYGDPAREQRALAAGRAWVDQSHRGVVTVTGPDRLGWLHSLTSQHLEALAPGVSTETLVLSPHGHVEHALHVVDDGTTTWLTTEPGAAAELATWLERMRFMKRVEVADVTDRWAVVAGTTALPADAAAATTTADGTPAPAAPAWTDPWPRTGPDTAVTTQADEAGHPGLARPWVETLVPRHELAARTEHLPLAGTWAAEALRVAAWRPRAGVDSDHRTLVHELDWLRTAVHLHKGCYRGQETVARVQNLGRAPRRLVMLHLDGSEHEVPPAGAPVTLDGRAVGRVTTVARHHELGPVALAVVKRQTPPDAVLLVGIARPAGDPLLLSAAQEVVVAP